MTTLFPRAALLAASTIATFASSLPAQSLASRVAAAPAGDDVRLEYATRDGTCGDGRSTVRLGRLFHGANWEGYGTFGPGSRCAPGDARVTIVRRDGAVTEVRAVIGGDWPAAARGTSLGRVSAPEAAAYFLSLSRTGELRAPRGAMWAAAIADSTEPARQFLAIATDEGRAWKDRRSAMTLAGATGDASMVAELERIARSGAGDDSTVRRKKDEGNLAGAATDALGAIGDDAGIEALLRLAVDAPTRGVRKQAVFHVAGSGDPRGVRLARQIAEDERASDDVRQSAIFALLNRDDVGQAERQWARALFPRLTTDRMRDPILMGLAQHGSPDDRKWVLSLAADAQLPVKVRRQAVFWAGQGGAPIDDILGVYRTVDERQVKEHVIFALSQREESAATDALVTIAKGDADREMRKKALFWLGQRKDDRAAKVLTDIINNQ
jgi:HEAT repeat protein